MTHLFISLPAILALSLSRETVCNDEARETAEANANDTPIDGSEDNWFKVSPFGRFRGSKPGRDQYFYEAESNAIVNEFNSMRGRLGRMFRGAPIFIGHPDENPDLYTDHRRLGKILKLETRNDGLWAEVEWNSLGQENIREGYWVYPSPRWDAPAQRNEFRPDRLISIGLTNRPRIPTSEPVTNSLDQSPPPEQTNQTSDMDRKLLCEKLGLDVTCTDEEILAKITSMQDICNQASQSSDALRVAEADAATAKQDKATMACSLDAERIRADKAEADLKATREAHANALLDSAETSGRITRADRAQWLPRLTGENRETEANALAAITPKLNTAALDHGRSHGDIADEKSRRETVANAVNDIMTKKRVSYHEAWNIAKKDPALKPVFDAMKSPGQ